MKLEGQAAYLLGKSMALIEDIFIGIKGDPLLKADFHHKLLLLKQDIDRFLEEAFKDNN